MAVTLLVINNRQSKNRSLIDDDFTHMVCALACHAGTNRVRIRSAVPLRAGHAGGDGLPVHARDAGLLFHRLQARGELLDHLHLGGIGL